MSAVPYILFLVYFVLLRVFSFSLILFPVLAWLYLDLSVDWFGGIYSIFYMYGVVIDVLRKACRERSLALTRFSTMKVNCFTNHETLDVTSVG